MKFEIGELYQFLGKNKRDRTFINLFIYCEKNPWPRGPAALQRRIRLWPDEIVMFIGETMICIPVHCEKEQTIENKECMCYLFLYKNHICFCLYKSNFHDVCDFKHIC